MSSVKKIRCSGNRSLKDIAFEIYGSLDGMFDILLLNPDLIITDIPNAGDMIYVRENTDKNKVVIAYQSDGYIPSTGADVNIPPFPNIFDNTFSSTFN
jgi:hypothetical protein